MLGLVGCRNQRGFGGSRGVSEGLGSAPRGLRSEDVVRSVPDGSCG